MMAFKWSESSETCCVLSSPGDLNKSGVCFLVKHSESRDMRPRHCVWKCCGDANVTRCCPLSHVTSVIDAEWFWKWREGKKECGEREREQEGGLEVKRQKEMTVVSWTSSAPCGGRGDVQHVMHVQCVD